MIANRDGNVSPGSWDRPSSVRPSRWTASHEEAIDPALERTRDWLLDRQDAEGYWVGELEGDTILESEYILLMTFLGRESDEVCRRCARYIQDHQMPGGGWAIYPGGPADVSASVKAYFALKLTGRSPDEPEMVRREGRSWTSAVRTRATASRGSTSPSSARSITTRRRASPRS